MSLGTQEERTEGMKKQAKYLIEQAYQRGYKEGYSKAENDYHAKTEEDRQSSYELGLNMAWEAAKKIYLSQIHGGISGNALVEIFGYPTNDILERFSASEAIEKLKEYEEQKKQEEDTEIRVGDEIQTLDGQIIGIVTYISKIEGFSILWRDGSVGKRKNIYDYEKTGRAFPEIVEVLKKMQEGK